jgi:L-alanine-DL-glutamate epimerase-like enolase superfamily enzyme
LRYITEIKTEVLHIELKTPFITALRRVENVEFVRVSVICNDGSIGFGEAPSTYAITKEDISTIINTIDNIKDKFYSLTPKDAIEILLSLDIGSSAKASLDIAFLDLDGFFSVEDSSVVKTDITISLNDKQTMLQESKKAYDNGMDILKIKFGSDIEHAIDVTKLISTSLKDAKLLIDANQAWSLDDTLKYIDASKSIDIELIEQPVLAKDLDSLKIISNYSDIPILADEAVFNLNDVKNLLKLNAADMINIKLMKCGGVSEAIKILEYARACGIKCMLGSMLEGPISINAALYLAFNYRDVIKYIDLDSPLLYKEMPQDIDFTYKGCRIYKF